MNLELPNPGVYILAVSGGVDSMVLLHLLAKQPGLQLVVAHLDHGIREDSAQDRRLVQDAAHELDVPFVYHEARLGPDASEATARQARYAFLRKAQRVANARAIITAHHADDRLETAILNLQRGTGRKGLTSLQSQDGLLRPLLEIPKIDIVSHAKEQGIVWREDSTNASQKYARNHVRHHVLKHATTDQKQQLHVILNMLSITNRELDKAIVNLLHQQSKSGQIDRVWFSHLPHKVAKEVLATWLRKHGAGDFTKQTLERLVVQAKTKPNGTKLDVQNGTTLYITPTTLALRRPER